MSAHLKPTRKIIVTKNHFVIVENGNVMGNVATDPLQSLATGQ
jgi:hypothetical protein